MALESFKRINDIDLNPNRDLIEIYNQKTGMTGVINPSQIAFSSSPSGVAGAIQFSNGSAFASDASNLFWDDTNNYLGIGTNTPTVQLEVQNNARIRGGLNLNGSLSNSSTGIVDINSLTYVNGVSGFVGVGISTPSARLHIKGSGSTSATTSLLVQNSAGTTSLKIPDDGILQLGSTGLNGKIQFNRTTDGNGVSSIGSSSNILVFTEFSGSGFRFDDGYGTFPLFMANSRVSINRGSISDASAQLQIDSTNRGFLPPRMTTTQKNAIATPSSGLVVYDSTTNKLCCYNGSTWNDLF